MNDRKMIDEVPLRSLAEAPAQQAADSRLLDHRRRRLIRGAAGIAPIVITLRSGALAAASCVNTKALGTTDGTGLFTPSTGTPNDGDRCVANYETSNLNGTCTGTQILPKSQSTGVDGGLYSISTQKCSGITGTTNVAMVSLSVTSFV